MVAGCDHDWRWLERPVFTIGQLGQLSHAFNVECTRCGKHSWAHGRAPHTKPATMTVTPTTERS